MLSFPFRDSNNVEQNADKEERTPRGTLKDPTRYEKYIYECKVVQNVLKWVQKLKKKRITENF